MNEFGQASALLRSGDRDVWTLDLERNTLSKLTTDPAMDNYPLWTPDGELARR